MKYKLEIYFLSLFLLTGFSHVCGQMVSDRQGPEYPWTRLPEIDGDKFRFVILADKNGGERSGIFEQAIELINGERPDFIVSSGDLIDGYTTDTTYLRSMWGRLTQSVSRFEAPLFYLIGNHDVSNDILRAEWFSRFGCAYYSFTIGNNLFLMLDTEERFGDGGITDEQAAYFTRQIARAPVDANIFVFMHRPLWLKPEKSPYLSVHKAIVGRKAYVFCGHTHHYSYQVRDGIPHYMLATLGGDSRLRGLDLGEFDHYLILDVEGDMVTVRNKLIDGREVPVDIVNDKTWDAVNVLRDGQWVSVEPAIASERSVENLRIGLVFRNPLGIPLHVEGVLPAGFLPVNVNREIAPYTVDTLYMRYSDSQLTDMEMVSIPRLILTGDYALLGKRIAASAEVSPQADYVRNCGSETLNVCVDNPVYIRESWDWHGPNDGCFRFSLWADLHTIYIDIHTEDDIFIGDSNPDSLQDKLFVQFTDDAEPWILLPGRAVTVSGASLPEGVKATCISKANSLEASLSIPRPAGMQSFRLNIGFMDHDNPLNTKPSVLWWRHPFATDGDYPEAGKFILMK